VRLLIAEAPDPLEELGDVIGVILGVRLPELVERWGQRIEGELKVARVCRS
jgi:hypothetical protein